MSSTQSARCSLDCCGAAGLIDDYTEVLIALSAVPGYLFWQDECARTDLLMTVWSSVVLGLSLRILLGWRGNSILRRFSLRSDAPYVARHLESMLIGASYALKDFMVVSTETLTSGQTLYDRKHASDEIRRKMRSDSPRNVSPDTEEIYYLEKYAGFVGAAGSHPVVLNLYDLQNASHSFCGACRSIRQIAESMPETLTHGISILLEAALDLCDICNSILAEAGVLEEGGPSV